MHTNTGTATPFNTVQCAPAQSQATSVLLGVLPSSPVQESTLIGIAVPICSGDQVVVDVSIFKGSLLYIRLD